MVSTVPEIPVREPLLQFFKTDHLRDDLRSIVEPFRDLAELTAKLLPANQQRSAAIHHLLLAKDCAVRARLFQD